MTQERVRLAVIMPVYGNWADTMDCIRLLCEQNCHQFHLILADDGSPQAPPNEVASFPFLQYLRLPHAGYASTCNAAAELARQQGFTHLLLLNNDVSFGREFIGGWLSKIAASPTAIIGPIIYYYDHPQQIWYSGGPMSMRVPFRRYCKPFDERTRVDVMTGCTLGIPMRAWIEVGGFDSIYTMYYEDYDFMVKAKRKGYLAFIETDAALSIYHKVSRTSLLQGRWSRDYLMIRSRYIFIMSHYSGMQRIICLAVSIPHLLITILANLPSLPSPTRLTKAVLAGLLRHRQ